MPSACSWRSQRMDPSASRTRTTLLGRRGWSRQLAAGNSLHDHKIHIYLPLGWWDLRSRRQSENTRVSTWEDRFQRASLTVPGDHPRLDSAAWEPILPDVVELPPSVAVFVNEITGSHQTDIVAPHFELAVAILRVPDFYGPLDALLSISR